VFEDLLEKSVEKIPVYTKTMYFYDDSYLNSLTMENISNKSCKEHQNTNFKFIIFFFRKSCPLWDDAEKYDTPGEATDDSMICHMRIACWVTKVPNKHLEYVTLIAFPLQQWICEHASMLRYAYTACLVNILYKRVYFFLSYFGDVRTQM